MSDIPYIKSNKGFPNKGKNHRYLYISIIAILSVFLSLALITILHQKDSNDKLKTEIEITREKINNLEQQRNQSLHLYIQTKDTLNSIRYALKEMPFVINDIEFAIEDNNHKRTIDFGKRIEAARTQYLKPKLKYYGICNCISKVYIKFFYPSGMLSDNDTSPSGYTYFQSVNIKEGWNEVILSGWGGSNLGFFHPGTYVFEIWYNERCIGKKSIVFHES